MKIALLTIALVATIFYGCNGTSNEESSAQNITPISIDFKSTRALNNPAAYVTSQCYTKTTDENNQSHNPCFSCHINSKAPNCL